MSNSKQKEAFLTYEADAWFDRNKQILLQYSASEDHVISMLKKYSLNPNSVLEIGCSGGYRLNGIKNEFKRCDVFGLEPSEKAIEYGKKHYTDVVFTKGTADNLSKYEDQSMDVIIVGFVFYVVDRTVIFKMISEIDRVLKDKGILIIVDFFSVASLKNTYQHISEFTAYSFKQNYDEVFTSSKLYYLLDKSTLNHENRMPDASDDYHNKYSVSLLKKDINASYK